jgi:hypothetical protein
MKRRILNRRAWLAVVTGALILGIGQIGRLPVPARYSLQQTAFYGRAARLSAGAGRRAEVVLLGNSRIEAGLRATTLARCLSLRGAGGGPPKVINLATPGGVPAASFWLWRHMCRSRRPPATKLLIVGVSPIDLTPKFPAAEYALRYLFQVEDVPWLVASGELTRAATVLTYRLMPLYAYSASFRNIAARRPAERLVSGGPSWREGWLSAFYDWYRDYQPEVFQVDCLERLVRDARGRGVQVILVAPPIGMELLKMAAGGPTPPEVRLRRPNAGVVAADRSTAPLPVFRRAVSRCVRRNQVPFFDYMTAAESVRFSYLDLSHLTRPAAHKFTADVARRINALNARGVAATRPVVPPVDGPPAAR